MCHCDWEWLGKDLWAKKSTRHQNNNMYFGKTCMYVLYEIACFCSIPWAWTWTLSPLCQSILCRAAAVVVCKNQAHFLRSSSFEKKCVSSVMEFLPLWGLKSKIFWPNINMLKGNYCILWIYNVKNFRLGFRKITRIIAYTRHYKLQLFTQFFNTFSLFSRSFFQKILSLCMVRQYSAAVCNQERVMMAHVRY